MANFCVKRDLDCAEKSGFEQPCSPTGSDTWLTDLPERASREEDQDYQDFHPGARVEPQGLPWAMWGQPPVQRICGKGGSSGVLVYSNRFWGEGVGWLIIVR
jgi:hypothetical protein